MSTRHSIIDTALGELTLVAQHDALTGVFFPKHWHLPATTDFGPLVDAADDAVFRRATTQFAEYFAGRRTDFDLPVALHGSAVRRRIWDLLTGIPYGETVTYGELAAAVGDSSAWEVGQAVGRNPVSILVPCHRVIGKDGKLTGYAGGLARKQALLDLEGSALARLF
ncbi:methylated-DNA--[protein]-cysteine S-methyltransferase [soil metagenome]